MRELKVLDFAGLNCCPSIPPSLSHLTNLRALYLYQCILEDITLVSELTNLEILSLMNSEIKELPAELAQLTHLRMLNLTHCSALTAIPANLLSSLTCLEELYMGNCFIQWEAEGSHRQSNNASLGELRHLHKLTALNLQIQDACILPKDLHIFGQLESYKIVIGDNFEWSWIYYDENQQTSRTLKLNLSTATANIHLDHGIKMLLNCVEDLYLANLKGIENVLYQLNGEGFPQLKHLNIQNSDEVQFIIDSTEWVHSHPAFPNLESLVLHNLTNLEKLCHGPFPMQSLTKLKVIRINGCERLRNLIVYELLRDLPQLAEVEISQCTCMTEIVVQHDIETDKIMLPKLRSLTLDCLPMLARLYSKLLTADARSENQVADYKDVSSMAVTLFDEKIVFPNLESLKLSSVNLRTIWDDQLSTHSCIQNLTSLTIDNCDCLKYVFSSPVARELVKLQYLKITRCKMLEEIFVPQENLLSNEEAMFPRLKTLVISHMDSLKSVWKTHLAPKSFGKLHNMEIAFCKKMSIVFPCNVLNLLLNLETLLIINCDALEVVFENQELSTSGTQGVTVETKMRALTLEYLPVVNHVFPLSLAKELLQLQVLDIRCCGVQNIVANDGIAEAAPTCVFPKLTSLTLWILPKLRTFYSGLHILDCPSLRVLQVYHCRRLQLFTFQSQNYRVQMDVQPLFSFEKVIPNIEELTLSSKDVTMICRTQSRDDYFYNVKDLCLLCFHDKSDEFPSGFLQRFANLENLQLSCSSFVEIFTSESPDIEHPQKNIKLKSLTLDNLKLLEYLFKDSEMQQILQNLETLEVHACPRLKNVVPSSVLFQNLHTLYVGESAGLVNLVVSSTARSLLNLKTLMIHHCKIIEEIVNSEEGDAGEITFTKLEHLQLCGLPMLTSFGKGNQNFKFPLLRTIFVVECPMMETFS